MFSSACAKKIANQVGLSALCSGYALSPPHKHATAATAHAAHPIDRVLRRLPPLPGLRRRRFPPSRTRKFPADPLRPRPGSGFGDVVARLRRRGVRRLHGGRDRAARGDVMERRAHHTGARLLFLPQAFNFRCLLKLENYCN